MIGAGVARPWLGIGESTVDAVGPDDLERR